MQWAGIRALGEIVKMRKRAGSGHAGEFGG